MDVLLDLQGLIRGVRDDEICRKNLLKLCKFLIDRLTKPCDLLLIAHIDCQGDCTATLPWSSWVPPHVVVQIPGRALVAGEDLDQVPEINRSSGRSFAYNNIPNCVSAFKLTGGIENDLSLARLEFASRCNNVAGAQDLCESCRLQSVLGYSILRIF